MTKRLDPEIRAIRALERAMLQVPEGAEQRVAEWLVARWCGLGKITLPPVRKEAR
jgi:hypothetical protein